MFWGKGRGNKWGKNVGRKSRRKPTAKKWKAIKKSVTQKSTTEKTLDQKITVEKPNRADKKSTKQTDV
jgi:hypothetical protein